MSIDLGALAERPLEFIQHAAILIGIKLLVLFPLALAFGYSRADSVRMTFLLAQVGEFGFVLFGSALVLEVIDEPIFILAVAVISLSMLHCWCAWGTCWHAVWRDGAKSWMICTRI